MANRVPAPCKPRLRHSLRTGNRACSLAAALALAPPAAHAQALQSYLPAGVPGFDAQRGVTVLTRTRPDYQSLGLHEGALLLGGELAQSLGFDDDATGQAGGPSSAVARTAASASAAFDGSRVRLGLAADLAEDLFLSVPNEDRTEYDAAFGASAPLGRGVFDAAYAHRLFFQTGNDIGQLRADGPVRVQVDDARAAYALDLGPFSLTPNLDLSRERYGPAPFAGASLSQAFRDRDVLQAGVAARAGPQDGRGLLLVLLGSASSHPDRPPGQPDYDQAGALALAGIDYPSGGVWRWQVLAGVERRAFRSPQFATRVAPVVQAAAIWTPTGITTVTLDASRTIEDTSAEGSSGRTYTDVRAVLDHEYLRNVLLQLRARFQSAAFAQVGGTQTGAAAGAGATWLVNRRVRVSLDYDWSAASRSPGSGAFARNLLLLSTRLSL